MIVGGQEIYITGDLSVQECFWGDYNHGDLIVKGDMKTRVFVATEGYHYDYKRERIAADFFFVMKRKKMRSLIVDFLKLFSLRKYYIQRMK
jgi:hypothetical protein